MSRSGVGSGHRACGNGLRAGWDMSLGRGFMLTKPDGVGTDSVPGGICHNGRLGVAEVVERRVGTDSVPGGICHYAEHRAEMDAGAVGTYSVPGGICHPYQRHHGPSLPRVGTDSVPGRICHKECPRCKHWSRPTWERTPCRVGYVTTNRGQLPTD